MGLSEGSRRQLLRFGVGTTVATGLVGLSGTAGAHGLSGHGGDPIDFAAVVGLPIVAGLLGGAIAIRRLREEPPAPTDRRVGVVLGLSLAALGVTFATSAVASGRPLGIAGGAAGAVSVYRATRRGGGGHRACRADLALGAISAHRLFEGVALGTLYGAGAAVGTLGAILVSGHTAVETAAVGGLYATSRARARAVAAVIVVQLSYAGGAVVGLGVADALPPSAQAFALAVAGGALLVVGTGEASRSFARTPRPART